MTAKYNHLFYEYVWQTLYTLHIYFEMKHDKTKQGTLRDEQECAV